MRVKVFANLAEAAGEREITIDIESDTTIDALLEAVFAEYPSLREEVLTDGELRSHITMLLNGEKVGHDEHGLDRTISNDDEIALFPPVSGGSR